MKKEYAYSIMSLIVLFLGAACCIAAILLNVLSDTSKSVLMLLGACFILVGITSYAKHSKNYHKIKCLGNGEISLIAHWHFTPNSSSYISESLREKKSSAISTIILTFMLSFIIACCIFFSGEKYSLYIGLVLTTISIIACIAAYFYNNYYFDLKEKSPSEALIGEDCIYFLDDLYTLHKSIYFLEDIRINYGDENTLQFLYGDYDLFTGPMYTINIPIPEGQLDTAKHIQLHYLSLIEHE